MSEISVEREYHNLAKEYDDELAFAIWREICIQSAILIDCICGILLINYSGVSWHWFIMLGAPASLALFWLRPKIHSSHSNVLVS